MDKVTIWDDDLDLDKRGPELEASSGPCSAAPMEQRGKGPGGYMCTQGPFSFLVKQVSYEN